MNKKIIIPGEREETPDEVSKDEVRVDVSGMPEDVEVVVRKVHGKVTTTIGRQIDAAQSFDAAQKDIRVPLAPEKKGEVDEEDQATKQEKPKDDTPAEASQEEDEDTEPKKRRSLKEIYQSDKFAGRIAAGAGAAAAVPPFLYLSGIGSLPLGIAGLSAAALAAPIITYNLAKKHEHKSMAGIAGLGISGGIIAAQGVTLSTVGTIASAVALPATTAYAGYKIGKSKKHPIVGGFIGAGAGMVAAQGIAGIAAGSGWAAAGGVAAGSIVPIAAAGAAWVGFKGAKRSSSWAWNKWKNRKNKSEKQA